MEKQNYEEMYNALLKDYEKNQKRLVTILKQSDEQTKALLRLNEKLENAANTDPMTGAYNRRYFYEQANKIIKQKKEDNCQDFIAMIDIDKFKNINDTYGHDIGDIIIKDLVTLVHKNIDASMLFSRFGGEEFVLLFSNTTQDKCISFCNELRIKLEKSIPTDNIVYTVSVGVSPMVDGEKDIDISLKKADNALYEAKENGRNQVIIHL